VSQPEASDQQTLVMLLTEHLRDRVSSRPVTTLGSAVVVGSVLGLALPGALLRTVTALALRAGTMMLLEEVFRPGGETRVTAPSRSSAGTRAPSKPRRAPAKRRVRTATKSTRASAASSKTVGDDRGESETLERDDGGRFVARQADDDSHDAMATEETEDAAENIDADTEGADEDSEDPEYAERREYSEHATPG